MEYFYRTFLYCLAPFIPCCPAIFPNNEWHHPVEHINKQTIFPPLPSTEALSCIQPSSAACNVSILNAQYPKEYISNLLKKENFTLRNDSYFNLIKKLLKLKMYSPNRDSKSTRSEPRSEPSCKRCPTLEFTAFPKIGMRDNKEIFYIVNVYDFEGPGRQHVPFEVCRKVECQCGRCSPDDEIENTTCQQRYRSKILLYLNRKGKLEYAKFLIPSSCECAKKAKTLDSYFSIQTCCRAVFIVFPRLMEILVGKRKKKTLRNDYEYRLS